VSQAWQVGHVGQVGQVSQLGAVQRIKRCREHGRGVSHTKGAAKGAFGWEGDARGGGYTLNSATPGRRDTHRDATRYLHVRSYFTVLQLVLQFMHNKGRRPAHLAISGTGTAAAGAFILQ